MASILTIKDVLSEEIASATKTLQKDHIGTDSAIRSGDTANRICNVLEAIFLHELKESYEIKAFWPFLVKFTHRDICKQIDSLSQITTDVGRCRAWIRLALNDGLFESYMDSMMRDVKILKRFYKRTAYIRDVEHPEIMRKCAQGLSNFYFQLALNSSVLNMWGSSPKMLTGRWHLTMKKPKTNSPTSSTKSSDGSEDNFQSNRPHKSTSRNRSDVHEKETDIIPQNVTQESCDSLSDQSSFRECEMSRALLHNPSDGSFSLDFNQDKFSENIQDREEQIIVEPANILNKEDDNEERDCGIVFDAVECEVVPSLPPDVNNQSAEEIVESQMVENPKEDEGEMTSEFLEDSINFEKVQDRADKMISIEQHLPEEMDEDYIPPLNKMEESMNTTQNYSIPKKVEEDYTKDEIFGNSLGARSGWSSQFENSLILKAAHVQNGDSYTTLLNAYAENCDGPSLPSTDETQRLLGLKPQDARNLPSHEQKDDLLADYEIIPSVPSSVAFFTDPRVQQLLTIVSQISCEKGLDSQNYQCKGCASPIGIIYGKPRVCNFDACYYCMECHLDEDAIIPARILHNWDFRRHKVAQFTKTFLQEVDSLPLIDINLSNPKLYDAIIEVKEVKVLRTQLKYLKAYLFTCKQSTAEDLKRKVWPREYMLDHIHLYSIQDFNKIHTGQLPRDLRKVISWAAKHVYNCILCRQKGFICELCNSPKVIYPFDVELTSRCDTCKTVYHKACKLESKQCSKCRRIRQRKSQLTSPPGGALDFASPWS